MPSCKRSGSFLLLPCANRGSRLYPILVKGPLAMTGTLMPRVSTVADASRYCRGRLTFAWPRALSPVALTVTGLACMSPFLTVKGARARSKTSGTGLPTMPGTLAGRVGRDFRRICRISSSPEPERLFCRATALLPCMLRSASRRAVPSTGRPLSRLSSSAPRSTSDAVPFTA